MDEVTGTIIRIPVAIVLLIVLVIGIVGLLKTTSNKKLFVVLLVIPFILVYTMYFSGYVRKSPLTKYNVQEILEVYQDMCKAENCQNPLKRQTQDGIIKYEIFLRKNDFDELTSQKGFINLFSQKGNIDGKSYLIEPIWSDKGEFWTAYCHDGYVGSIYVQLNNSQYLYVYYKISRRIDKWLGFFYAPPLFERFTIH